MIFDTHSHLFSEEFDNDREECLKRCDELNMKLMLVGYSHIGNQQAYDLAQKNLIIIVVRVFIQIKQVLIILRI